MRFSKSLLYAGWLASFCILSCKPRDSAPLQDENASQTKASSNSASDSGGLNLTFSKILSQEQIEDLTSLQTLKTLPTKKSPAIQHESAKLQFLAESNARISRMTVARHADRESNYALKYPISKDETSEFKAEAKILKNVGVPANNNVVQFYAYIPTQELPVLAMEILSKENLAAKPFNVSLNKQMANGIHQVHEAGYVHGDVKFENAGLTLDEKTVRVIDFGSAFKLEPGSYPAHYEDVGTNGLRAPELEMAKGKNTPMYLSVKKDENGEKVYYMSDGELYDPSRLDSYALAMSFYRKKYNLSDIDFMRAKSGKPLPVLKTDDPMDRLIKKGLEKDPAHRPSFEAFKNELDQIPD